MRSAIESVKARNNGVLTADDLFLHLACEIVARDNTLAEAGQACAERIAGNLDMDSRRREVALRAEVEDLTSMLRAIRESDCEEFLPLEIRQRIQRV
jgi:hypothetical protein